MTSRSSELNSAVEWWRARGRRSRKPKTPRWGPILHYCWVIRSGHVEKPPTLTGYELVGFVSTCHLSFYVRYRWRSVTAHVLYVVIVPVKIKLFSFLISSHFVWFRLESKNIGIRSKSYSLTCKWVISADSFAWYANELKKLLRWRIITENTETNTIFGKIFIILLFVFRNQRWL